MSKQPKLEEGQHWQSHRGLEFRIGRKVSHELYEFFIGGVFVGALDADAIMDLVNLFEMTLVAPALTE
jgi:hypothetical protein